jgi:hypothetical protein
MDTSYFFTSLNRKPRNRETEYLEPISLIVLQISVGPNSRLWPIGGGLVNFVGDPHTFAHAIIVGV